MTTNSTLEALAERCDDFVARMESIAASNMTPSAQTSAAALLASLKGFGIARDAAAALREMKGEDDGRAQISVRSYGASGATKVKRR